MLAVSLRQSFVTNRLVTILRWWMAGLFCTYLYFNIIVRLLISIFSRKAWFTSRLRCCFSCSQFPNFVISVQVWWRWDGKTVRGITKPHAAKCGRASSCLVFIEIGLSLLDIKTRYSHNEKAYWLAGSHVRWFLFFNFNKIFFGFVWSWFAVFTVFFSLFLKDSKMKITGLDPKISSPFKNMHQRVTSSLKIWIIFKTHCFISLMKFLQLSRINLP